MEQKQKFQLSGNTILTAFVAVAFAIFVVNIVAVLIPSLNYYPGPTMQILIMAAAVIYALTLSFQKLNKQPVMKIELFLLLALLVLTLLAFIFLPDLLPSTFDRGAALVGLR